MCGVVCAQRPPPSQNYHLASITAASTPGARSMAVSTHASRFDALQRRRAQTCRALLQWCMLCCWPLCDVQAGPREGKPVPALLMKLKLPEVDSRELHLGE